MGPLTVQRPFFPEGAAVCHVYFLHPPGGVVGGDTLALDVDVGAGAHALLTTPAATKIYRTAGPTARVRQTLRVAAGGALEWLPQEVILHEGAAVALETQIIAEPGARFIAADALCFGLPARGEGWTVGRCRQRLEIWSAARPLLIERARLDAGAATHTAAWGRRSAPVVATLLASPAPGDDVVQALRGHAATLPPEDLAGITRVADDTLLVCRYLGASAERARRFLHEAWGLLRPAVLGREPRAPRIWAT